MSGRRFIFKREDSFNSTDVGVNFHWSSDEENAEDDGDDDFDFLQNIPYSSSSLDRSSIGSIPWADDAIKKNQLDWERVERMLHGQEEPPEELELRNEIREWQQKFPCLIEAKVDQQQDKGFDSNTYNNLVDSIDIYSISNLSLNTLNDRIHYDDNNATPTRQQAIPTDRFHDTTKSRDSYEKAKKIDAKTLHTINKDFQVDSVPLRLSQRYASSGTGQSISTEINPAAQATILFPQLRPIGTNSPMDSAFFAPTIIPDFNRKDVKAANMRVPPILNVLESKRRFRGLTGNKRSFVQLTHVQQAKSAAATANHSREWQSTAWHLPFSAATVSNRFFNNRKSIILPSIKSQREPESNSSDDNSDPRRYSVSSVSPTEITGVGRRATTRTMILNQTPRLKSNRDSSLTTTPATTSTTGRSISAALHPRHHFEFNALYLPYSASKFKSFK